MDRFLNMGLTARGGGGAVANDAVGGLGMHDLSIKGSIKPAPGWVARAHMHWLWTAEDTYVGTNSLANITAANVGSQDIGQELDLDLIHAYNSFTKIVFGYSHFFTDDLMEDVNHRFQGGDADGSDDGGDADWAYIMVDVQF